MFKIQRALSKKNLLYTRKNASIGGSKLARQNKNYIVGHWTTLDNWVGDEKKNEV
jgi:hypothetical protein